MKKLLVLLLLITGVNAELHYERTEYGFSEICDYYTIIPFKDMIASTPKIVKRNLIHGEILDDRWEYLIEKEKEIEILHYKEKCERVERWVFDEITNKSEYKNVTDCRYFVEFIERKKVKIQKWEKHQVWDFKLGEPVFVRYCAKIRREHIPKRGWVIEVDNIPYFNKVEYPEYVWWNSTYKYRRLIDCSNITDRFPLVINGSGGFDLGCGKNIVWTYCSGVGTALYYNNCSDYVVANDTDQLPMEVERGNGTSYNPTQIWDNTTVLVQHLEENPTGDPPQMIDSSQYGNNGTTYGSMTSDDQVDGKIDGSLDFDGSDDYVDCGSDSSLDIINGSVEVWIQPNVIEDGRSIVRKNLDTKEGYALWFNWNYLYYELRDGNYNIVGFAKVPYNTLTAGQWYQIVGTHESNGKIRLYINGELKDEEDVSGTVGFSGDHLRIGAGWNVNEPFNGTIDEVRIYNRALSAEEINMSYQNAIGTTGFGNLKIKEVYPTTTTINYLTKEYFTEYMEKKSLVSSIPVHFYILLFIMFIITIYALW